MSNSLEDYEKFYTERYSQQITCCRPITLRAFEKLLLSHEKQSTEECLALDVLKSILTFPSSGQRSSTFTVTRDGQMMRMLLVGYPFGVSSERRDVMRPYC